MLKVKPTCLRRSHCDALSDPRVYCLVSFCPVSPCTFLYCPGSSCPLLCCPALCHPALSCSLPCSFCPALGLPSACPALSCPRLSCPALHHQLNAQNIYVKEMQTFSYKCMAGPFVAVSMYPSTVLTISSALVTWLPVKDVLLV